MINEGQSVEDEGQMLDMSGPSPGTMPRHRSAAKQPYVDLGHWNRMYTNPEYFRERMSENERNAAPHQLDQGEAFWKRQANISYLAELTKTSPLDMAEMYEARKGQLAQVINGSNTISDEGVFQYFSEQFDIENQRTQTAGDIFTAVMQEGVKQSFEGKPVNHVPLLSQKLDEAGDMFSDEERTKLREEIDEVMTKVGAVQDMIAPEARWIFDMMATQTGRPDAKVDDQMAGFYFEEAINRFAQMERPERERTYELVRAFAELSGDPKGWFQTLGEQFSRGLSDIYERVPRNWREGDLYNAKQQLGRGEPLLIAERKEGQPTYMMAPVTTPGDMGELGAVAVEQTMRRRVGPVREATAEERQAFEEEIDNKIAAVQVERELRDLAQSGVDPSGQSRDPRWWKQILDEGLWASARSVPYTALAGMPFGLGLLGVGNALYAQNMDELAMDYPDMSYEKRALLAGFSAPIEAVTERIKWLTITGKLPLTGALMRRLNHPGRGPWTRILFGFGAINVEQNVQEIIQENTLPFFQTIAAAVMEDMPEYDWKTRFEGMPRELAVQFVALFPLTLMGGGALTYREMQRGESYLKTRQNLLELGMDQPAIDRIVSALTPDEAQAAFMEEDAKLTDEQRLKGYERIIERVMAGQQKEPDVAGPRIVKNSKEPNNYDVLDRDGNNVAEGVTADEAVETHRSLTARANVQMEEVQQRLIDYFLESAEQRKAAGLDGDLDTVIEIISREAMKELEDMTPEQWTERIRQWEIEHGVSAEGLNFSVIGRNDLEQISETMFRSVSRLVRARSPEQVLRVIEEVAEGNLKMMWRRGSYTRQQVFAHLKQYELYSGESLNLPETWSDTINDQLLTEAFSTLAVAYFTKQIDRGTLPEMIASFLRVIGEFIAATLVRAENIIAGLESGKIDPDFEIALAASVGLNPDMRVENRAESKRQAVAAGQPIDPNQPLPAASFAVTVNVAPVRTDRLDKMTKGEVMKRAKSSKFIHLQQIVTEVGAAYGVPISARYPLIGGWLEDDGTRSLEVPESIIFETDDFAMANEMAALIAISAPELQNAAFVWTYDKAGPHAEYRFQAKSAEAALEIVKTLQDSGQRGFSYDPKTREFSIVVFGNDATIEAKLYEFVGLQNQAGRIGSRGRVRKAVGRANDPGEKEYRDAIAAARVRAGTAGAGRGEALRAAADRAQRRLDRSEAAKRTAEQAKAILQSLAQPRMAASRVQAELKGRQFDNIRAFGLWLDERFRRQVKKSSFDIGSKDGLENASNALVYDVLDGLSTDGSGMGWYDERVQETLRELAALHPEFNDDPFALAVYIGILAATSQGYTVMQNFQQADRVYADYKRTGRIPEGYKFAQSSPAINGNLQLINQLIDQYGLEGYTEFMDSEVTGRAIRDQYGLKAAGVTLAQVTRGNAVFGQKIGSFFNNLRGRFDTITMDLWYTRTMHRYLGETLVPLNTPKLQTALKKLRAELKKPGVRTYGVDIEKAMQDDEYGVQAGMRIMQKWGAGKNKYSEAGYFKFPDGYAIEKAARRVNALGGMKGAPQNKSHRNYFADIVRASKAKLDAMGIVLTEADIQAIIWYREKNLFASVGRANIAAKPADYLDAAMGLKRTRGADTTFAIDAEVGMDGFYSQLENVVLSKIQGKSATPEQVKAIIQNPQNKVKQDEIKWSGVMPAIDRIASENGGKVPKEALINYLRNERAIDFETVTYGDREWPSQSGVVEQLRNGKWQVRYPSLQNRLFETEEGANKELERLQWLFSEKRNDTRYGQYTLEGGANYREVVLTMLDEVEMMHRRKDRINNEIASIMQSPESVDGAGKQTPEAQERLSQLRQEAQSIEQDLATAGYETIPAKYARQEQYTSRHFRDAGNYVAHMRLNEREDVNGDTGLFIEEMQSDRHQAGRKQGYKGEREKDVPPGFVLKRLPTGEYRYINDDTGVMSQVYATAQRAVDEAWKVYSYTTTDKLPVPDAPFRKDWPVAMFKRALVDAVEKQLTWVGWTAGATQNERYDLSKKIEAVRISNFNVITGAKDVVDVLFKPKDNDLEQTGWQTAKEGVKIADLPEIIGTELADKFAKDGGIEEGKHFREYSGVDLEVGGEGMKGFYDNMLPKEVGKYVKQWGATVQKSAVQIDGEYNEEGEFIEGEWGTYTVPIWKVDLTPEMVASVQAGQPTFAISPDQADFARRIEALQEGESSPVDTSKTFWLIASSSGDIVDILGNEQDATTYFQTMASAGEWLWEYKNGLRTRVPLLKRGVAERRADGYIDTVRAEQERGEKEWQGYVYYGADTSPETPSSAGEVPSHTPDGRLWQGQNESVVYHGGRNLDPQGTDAGGYGSTQTLKPRDPFQTYSFAISPDQYYGDIEAAVAALDADPTFRRERVAGTLARFKAIKRQFENRDERLDIVEAVADLEAIIGLLPPEARAKMGGFRKLASFKSPKGRLNYLINRINEADKVLEEYLRKEFIYDIETMVERALPRRGDNRVQKGVAGVAGTKIAQMADQIIGMTSEQVATRMAEIEAAMSAPGTTSDQLADLIEEWGLLNTLGDLYKRTAAELDAARTYLRQTFGAGRAMWRIMEEARREEVRAMAEEMAEKLKKATPQTLKAQDPGQNRIKQFMDWAKGYMLSHWSFQQLLRSYLPNTSFTMDWADRSRRADIEATRYATEAAIRLLKAIGTAIGSQKGRDIGRAYYNARKIQKGVVRVIAGREVTMERISIDLATAILEGRASAKEAGLLGKDLDAIRAAVMAVPLMNERLDSRGRPYLIPNRTRYVEWERVLKAGTEEKLDMSAAEAMQFLLSWGQEAVRERMMRQGWTEDSVEDMRKLVEATPGAMAAMDFLKREYEQGGDAADPVYQRMFGMAMPRIENYAPTRYMNRDDTEGMSPFGAMPGMTGMTPGPLKTRVEHNARMRQEDAFSVFTQQVVQMGHWIAWAELNREIRGVLKNPKVREGMEATFGRNVVQIFDRWMDSLAQRGNTQAAELALDNKFLNMLVAGKSISSLGGNLRTVFMQTDAGARMLFAMPLSEVAKATANIPQLLADMPKAWSSDTVQRRIVEGTSPEIRFIFESARVKPSTMLRLASYSMMPMVYTDTVLTSIVAAMVYRYNYQQATKAGAKAAEAEKTALEAMDRAVYNFAQPIDITSRSLREISGAKGVRIFMMFQSDMRLKTAVLSEALYGLAKGDKAKRGMYAQQVAGIMFLALINQTMGNFFRDWFSDEPDEDIWTWEGYAMAMMLAPFSGLFLAGAAADVFLNRTFGQKSFSGAQNPLISAAEKTTTAMFNMDKLASDDPQEVMRQLNNMTRAISIFGPKSAAPAAILNALKPIEGAMRNAESPEERPAKNLNRW